jgi:hypothetical protein
MHQCPDSTGINLAQSARELTAVTWGQELAIALKQCNTSLRHRDDFEDEPSSLLSFRRKAKAALREVWKEVTDVFDIGYALSYGSFLYSLSFLIGPRKRLRVLTDSQKRSVLFKT